LPRPKSKLYFINLVGRQRSIDAFHEGLKLWQLEHKLAIESLFFQFAFIIIILGIGSVGSQVHVVVEVQGKLL